MFRTPIALKPIDHPISLNHSILSIGSCFADFIGNTLLASKFKIERNPFGIIFHPLAQIRLLELALRGALPPSDSYVNSQGVWYNYLCHGMLSDVSRSELESNIEQLITRLHSKISELDYLLLTFGTSIQYVHKEHNRLVANCHKVPQHQFQKSFTNSETIAKAFSDLYSRWNGSRPKVIISVSPVRHIKEGIEHNSLSKSILRVACENICSEFPEVVYFPGYEIMMDDLRDYRYFEKDMIHPNETARDYIWDLFKSNYLDQEAQDFLIKWEKISSNLAHRPFHPNSMAHQEFLKKTLEMIEQLPQKIDTTAEVKMLKENLI